MAGDRVPEIMSFRCSTESTATLSLEVINYMRIKDMCVRESVSSPVFKLGGYDWEIKFFPGGRHDEDDGYASCYLWCLSQGDHDHDVSVGLALSMLHKKSQEPVVSFVVSNRVFSSGKYGYFIWGLHKFVDKAKLESLSQEGDGGCFTILCVLTVTNESPQPPMDLPGDLEGMLRGERGMDVTFKVGGQEYRAHRFVLAARSPVFSAMLFGPMAEKDMRCLDIADMHPLIFKKMLHYIYTGSLPKCGAYSAAEMQHLLVAADRYGLETLKLGCEDELCEKLDAKTITTSMKLADQHGCKRLKDACLEFVSKGRRRLRPRVV
ncbi:BTB/POZ and MATH domain-containing protein 2-like [Lolium perenne]|nr:BTB/POZ and MATH domain-containing protein 2-like [Lolium perenne]